MDQIRVLHNLIRQKALEPEREAMEEFTTSRSICTVYHFTPIQNLPSICQQGILSRDQAELLRDPNLVFPDTWRTDGAKWGICCSIEWPNYKMMYMKQRYKSLEFAVMTLNASVLWDFDCVFLAGNAARADLRDKIPYIRRDYMHRLNQLKALYPKVDQRKHSWQCYPEDPQAEVLIDQPAISLEYCVYIYFNSLSTLYAAKVLPWPAHIKCELYPQIFTYRPDQTW